jgi:hypothetical protein
LAGGEQVFIIREEEDCFTEETHMEEQEKVRITADAKAGVEEEEEEDRTFNQE